MFVALLQKKNSSDLAQSTTEEEFRHNLYHICRVWQKEVGDDQIILCYDNNKIQAGADISTLEHPDGEHPPISIHVEEQRLKLPTYSPDLNRPIEHLFGCVKTKIRQTLYEHYPKYKSGRDLQTLVWDQFHKWCKKHLQSVANDVSGLPMLWQVLSTPFGITFFG